MHKRSSDFCYGNDEGSLWQHYCFTVLKFLQNNKTFIVLSLTALVSVMIAVFCIYLEGWKEYIVPVTTENIPPSPQMSRSYIPMIDDDGKVNIAVADAQTLDTLHGIGEVLAVRIIEEREKEPFHTIEDIMKVNGIGFDKFEKLKNKITLGKE